MARKHHKSKVVKKGKPGAVGAVRTKPRSVAPKERAPRRTVLADKLADNGHSAEEAKKVMQLVRNRAKARAKVEAPKIGLKVDAVITLLDTILR